MHVFAAAILLGGRSKLGASSIAAQAPLPTLPTCSKSTTLPHCTSLQAHYDDLKAEHDETCQKLDRCRGELEAARSEARTAAEQVQRGSGGAGLQLEGLQLAEAGLQRCSLQKAACNRLARTGRRFSSRRSDPCSQIVRAD